MDANKIKNYREKYENLTQEEKQQLKKQLQYDINHYQKIIREKLILRELLQN